MRGILFIFKRKFKYFIKSSIVLIKEKILHLPLIFPDKNTVLILRTDNIGDYVLFRNFLKILRGAPDFLNKKIILVGNENWRDLAEHFDSNQVDSFFWINKNRFYESKIYKIKIIFKLRQLRAYQIINTLHSRSIFEQDLMLFSGASKRITCEGDEINLSFKHQNLILFDRIVPTLPNNYFEFFRNKFFFENLLHMQIEIPKTSFNVEEKLIKTNQIILFPSAAQSYRRWSPTNFASVINSLSKYNLNLNFIILGNIDDVEIGNKIIENSSKNVNIRNLCGKTSLVDLINILSESRLLISNETSAVHIAVALDLPTVCISNGNHFGRFNPYPKSMTDKIITLYPNDRFYDENNCDLLIDQYQYKSELNIDDIKPETVFKAAKLKLEELNYD